MNDVKGITQNLHSLESIYDARVTFRIIERDKRVVNVNIRYSKKSKSKKEKLDFPDDIKDSELNWVGFRGEMIAVYHRKAAYRYENSENSMIPTDLGQKLERILIKANSK
jgi:hypothetical protein